MEDFIKQQSQLYQKYTTLNAEIEKQLKYQQAYKKFHTIPKHHCPQLLYTAPSSPTHGSQLNSNFEDQYKTLFFQHLDRVITHNTIILEINKTRQENIILETKKVLTTNISNPITIKEIYETFLTQNNITNQGITPHVSHPATTDHTTDSTDNIEQTLQANKDNSTTIKKWDIRKRKHQKQHPQPHKQSKTDRFLCQSSQQPDKPA